MQKSAIMTVTSGTLIVTGLVLSVIGGQIMLEGFSQGNGKISLDQTLTISTDFDAQDTKGLFNVQVIEFKDNTFSVRVLDPYDIEINSQKINEKSIEEKFDVFETGTYKLIIESTSDIETQVLGAIGPLPDAGAELFGFISLIIILSGMIGLVGSGIYAVKNRKRSI